MTARLPLILCLGGPRSEKVRRPLVAVGRPILFYRPTRSLRGLCATAGRLLGRRPAVVLVDGSGYQAFVGWLLGRILRSCFIVRLRGDIWRESRETLHRLRGIRRLGKRLKFRLGCYAITRADGIISVSRYLNGVVERSCPQASDRLTWVPTPIDARYVDEGGDGGDGRPEASWWADQIGIDASKRVVLTVMTFDFLEKAMAVDRYLPRVCEFLRRHPDAVYVVAGDGVHLRQVRQQIDAAGMPDQIKTLGFVDNVQALYRRAVFLLYFSFLDALPSVVQEAKACALPVIVNDAAGLPELVTHGWDGYIVSSDDAPELGGYMDALYADPDLRRRLGANGRQDALDRFQEVTIGKRLQSAIDAMVDGRRRRA